MQLKITGVLLFCLLSFGLQAQLRYGFKTGLNFSRFSAPSEQDANGKDLETFENITGFHIGMSFGYNFTDHFGVRGELLYSKKGVKYSFDGPSFRVFRYDGGRTITTGNSKYLLKINNAYFDLPVMAFARFGDFEVSGGVYGSVLVQTLGEGSLSYTGGKTAAPLNNPVADVEYNLSYNYRRDDPGQGIGTDQLLVKVDARNIQMPKTLGAYYDFPDSNNKAFNNFDYGLIGGVAYYLSSSLYAGVRVQYGLADLTNNSADASKVSLDNTGSFRFLSDQDRNFQIQASVGFSF
ncbi:MAG: outer membrane beta-barrel protein [Saprospiraceae bacterium]|jgi:hypothetical protein